MNFGSLEIAVLLPCHNEAISIGETVAAFRASLPTASIYVFDNNSTDNTADVARAAGAIVRVETQQGKGAVVRRMFRDIQADLYVMADGDNTYDATLAPGMVQLALQGPYDLVNCIRKETAEAAYRGGHRVGNLLLTGPCAGFSATGFKICSPAIRFFHIGLLNLFLFWQRGLTSKQSWPCMRWSWPCRSPI